MVKVKVIIIFVMVMLFINIDFRLLRFILISIQLNHITLPIGISSTRMILY